MIPLNPVSSPEANPPYFPPCGKLKSGSGVAGPRFFDQNPGFFDQKPGFVLRKNTFPLRKNIFEVQKTGFARRKPRFTHRRPRRRQLPVVPPVPPPETAPDIMMKSGEAS
jgi:hypothetical protein